MISNNMKLCFFYWRRVVGVGYWARPPRLVSYSVLYTTAVKLAIYVLENQFEESSCEKILTLII